MAFPAFKNVNPDDPIIDKLESNVAQVFSYLQGKAIIDGVLIEGVALLSSKTNLVPHLLQRRPRGYIVVKQNANATIWDSTPAANIENIYLQLLVSANVTVSLWVF